MPKIDDDFVIIHTELSGTMGEDGITIDVHIHRGKGETTWLLEGVDEEGTSIVWDRQPSAGLFSSSMQSLT